jgi:diaminopimelate decarboxylase
MRLFHAFTSQSILFREYFAVKACPNPAIMKIMDDFGFGFDCSSVPELVLARKFQLADEDIMFTSNNTSQTEFMQAMLREGCILNLDDISLLEKLPFSVPDLICFRYNPGKRRTGNEIIGLPEEAKYGVAHDQIVEAYRRVWQMGATRFGIHTMVCSNELNYQYIVETVRMLCEIMEMISGELGIKFEFMNMGGGLGIPYKPEDKEIPLETMANEIAGVLEGFKERNGYVPDLYLESGRYMTGPHGVLVTRAINQKDIYRKYIGVDACMSALMRPGMYGAYHHIDVLGKSPEILGTKVVDVVGSLCENIDKFAVQRKLPPVEDGDLLIIHDTGAHGHAMGFNYNARLRPQELMLRQDGSVELIRRKETEDDYFATLDFDPNVLE